MSVARSSARVVGVRVGKNVSCDRRSGQYGPSASLGRGVPLKGLEESQLAALTPAAGGGRLLARRHGAACYVQSAPVRSVLNFGVSRAPRARQVSSRDVSSKRRSATTSRTEPTPATNVRRPRRHQCRRPPQRPHRRKAPRRVLQADTRRPPTHYPPQEFRPIGKHRRHGCIHRRARRGVHRRLQRRLRPHPQGVRG